MFNPFPSESSLFLCMAEWNILSPLATLELLLRINVRMAKQGKGLALVNQGQRTSDSDSAQCGQLVSPGISRDLLTSWFSLTLMWSMSQGHDDTQVGP